MQQKIQTIQNHDKKLDIAYTEWGSADNPRVLFCVHGVTRLSRDFDFLAAALSQNYRVICPDVPGRGKSGWLENKGEYQVGHYAGHLLSFLDSLKIAEVDWIGTSMGGMIAFVAGAMRPHLIRKLVLNDVGPFLPKETLQRIAAYMESYPQFTSSGEALEWFKRNYAPFGIQKEAHWQHMLAHSLRQNDDGSYRLHYDPGIAAPFRDAVIETDLELWDLWDAMLCPALIVRGEKSDLLTRETVARMRQKGDTVDFIEIPGAGHAPSLMEEDQIQMLAQWLAKPLAMKAAS